MNHLFPADGDNVSVNSDLIAEMGGMSVNLYLSPLDKLLGLTAGTIPAFRKVFLKSYGFVFHIALTLLFLLGSYVLLPCGILGRLGHG